MMLLSYSEYHFKKHYDIYLSFLNYQKIVMEVVGVHQWKNVENHNSLLFIGKYQSELPLSGL